MDTELGVGDIFLKLVSDIPDVDTMYLDVLRDNLGNAEPMAHTPQPYPVFFNSSEMILTLTYGCVLTPEASTHGGVREIIAQASENNRAINVTGNMRVVDSLSQTFLIEEVSDYD